MGLFLFVLFFILYFSFRVFSKSSVWIELDSRPKLGQGCHNSWSPPYQILSVVGMGQPHPSSPNGARWLCTPKWVRMRPIQQKCCYIFIIKFIHCLIFVKKENKKTLYTMCDTTHIKREKRQLCAFSFLFSYLLKPKKKRKIKKCGCKNMLRNGLKEPSVSVTVLSDVDPQNTMWSSRTVYSTTLY
jgi:hypothetical protein